MQWENTGSGVRLNDTLDRTAVYVAALSGGERAARAGRLAELKAAMQTGIHIAQDHAYLPNDHELYHFMRPVGNVGNDDENIWLRVGPDGHALEPPPHETIRRAIARLGHHMVSDVRTH